MPINKLTLTLLDPFGTPILTVRWYEPGDPDLGFTGALMKESGLTARRVPMQLAPNDALQHMVEITVQ